VRFVIAVFAVADNVVVDIVVCFAIGVFCALSFVVVVVVEFGVDE
jgi:hypothetical protein